jgi:hypothetical protein
MDRYRENSPFPWDLLHKISAALLWNKYRKKKIREGSVKNGIMVYPDPRTKIGMRIQTWQMARRIEPLKLESFLGTHLLGRSSWLIASKNSNNPSPSPNYCCDRLLVI